MVSVTNECKEAQKMRSASLLPQSPAVPLWFAHGNQKVKGTWSATSFSRTISSPTHWQAWTLCLPRQR